MSLNSLNWRSCGPWTWRPDRKLPFGAGVQQLRPMARRHWCEDSVCWLEPRMSGSPCLSGFGLRGIGIGEGRRRPRENIVAVDVGAHGLHAAPALRLAHRERLLDPVREALLVEWVAQDGL